MLTLFTDPYDVQMHLISLFAIAASDGEIQDQENAYWQQFVGEYERKLGTDFDRRLLSRAIRRSMKVGSHSQVDDGILRWLSGLKNRPCSARYFIRSIIELAWCDGHLVTGEVEKILGWAKECGVSECDATFMMHCVHTKMLADSWLNEVMEKGAATRVPHGVQTQLALECKRGRAEILLASLRSFWAIGFVITAILCVVLFVGLLFSVYSNRGGQSTPSTSKVEATLSLPQLPVSLNIVPSDDARK